MQIEVGKFYRTRDGRKAGPVVARNQVNYDGPFLIDGLWNYDDDGKVSSLPEHRDDLVAEWTEATPAEPAEIGTLKELNVQPGDVVEFFRAVNGCERYETKHRGVAMTVSPSGGVKFTGSDGTRNGFSAHTPHTFRIVSRATPAEPASTSEITWGEWGRVRQGVFPRQSQNIDGKTTLWRYPVPKQPVVETVALHGNANGGAWSRERHDRDTARITFDVIDGKPDWSTLRGEDLS